MLQYELIDQFLNQKVIAVVGVSRKGDLPANYIFRKFSAAGYSAYPVNPNAEEVEGTKCYATLSDLPVEVEAVLFAGPPKATEEVMKECVEKNIQYVWIHKGIGQGSFSQKAVDNGEAHGIHVIKNGCPMMFVPKVDGFHKMLRWIKKW